MTMLAFRTDDPSSCGILELDERRIVVGFHEKVADPPGDLANGAVYVVGPEILERLAAKKGPFIDLSTQIIPELVGKVLAVEAARYHRDIGNPASLARAHAEFTPRPKAARSSTGR